MGRHSGEPAPEAQRSMVPASEASPAEASPAVSSPAVSKQVGPVRRAGRVKQAVTVCFAFSAAFSFLLVNIVDPYTGATASAEFAAGGDRFGGAAVQDVEVAGEYEISVARESYHVIEKPPEPPPAPEPEPGEEGGSGWAPPAITPDPGSAQAYAAGAIAARGWPSSEFDCLYALWAKESGWRVNAYNESSGAYGIPQSLPGSKMATAGADWETNAATQIEWGLSYITGRYTTPCGAWAKSQASGWY